MPSIVLPSIGLILLAVLMRFFLYAKRFFKKHNQVSVTLLGLLGLMALMYLGMKYPISLNFAEPAYVWSVILLVYAYFASIAPVNILLQPRDYLSSFLLFAGLGLGYIGIILHHPGVKLPAFVGFSDKAASALWPVLFITVACGASSDFYSLVASGTTSKQLPNEIYAKRIGYGGRGFSRGACNFSCSSCVFADR